jgi:hypothetical protein
MQQAINSKPSAIKMVTVLSAHCTSFSVVDIILKSDRDNIILLRYIFMNPATNCGQLPTSSGQGHFLFLL